MGFKVYIPARYQSSRLPGKLLLAVKGRSILQRVYENACASGAQEVVIATDHDELAAAAASFGATVVMTAEEHESGTDRIAEAARLNHESDEQLIVNVQGDEPLLPSQVIRQIAELLDAHPDADIATLCEPFTAEEQYSDPNVCKLVRTLDNRALYFSRAMIPCDRDDTEQHLLMQTLRRHIGIYAYRVGFLQRYIALPTSALEKLEKLEQLRALENGFNIVVADASADCGFGIDTAQDFERYRQRVDGDN